MNRIISLPSVLNLVPQHIPQRSQPCSNAITTLLQCLLPSALWGPHELKTGLPMETLLFRLSKDQSLTLHVFTQRLLTPFVNHSTRTYPLHHIIELPPSERNALMSWVTTTFRHAKGPTPCIRGFRGLIKDAIHHPNPTTRTDSLKTWCQHMLSIDPLTRHQLLSEPDEFGWTAVYHGMAGNIDQNGRLQDITYDYQHARLVITLILACENDLRVFFAGATGQCAPLHTLCTVDDWRSHGGAFFRSTNRCLLAPFQRFLQLTPPHTPAPFQPLVQTAVTTVDPVTKKQAYHHAITLIIAQSTHPLNALHDMLCEPHVPHASALKTLFAGTDDQPYYDFKMASQLLKLMIRCGLEPHHVSQHTNGFSLLECMLLRACLSIPPDDTATRSSVLTIANQLYFWCVPWFDRPNTLTPQHDWQNALHTPIRMQSLSIRDCESRNITCIPATRPSEGCQLYSPDPAIERHLKTWHHEAIKVAIRPLVRANPPSHPIPSTHPTLHPNAIWQRAPLGFRYAPPNLYTLQLPLGIPIECNPATPGVMPHPCYPFSVEDHGTTITLNRCLEYQNQIHTWSCKVDKKKVWQLVFDPTPPPTDQQHTCYTPLPTHACHTYPLTTPSW